MLGGTTKGFCRREWSLWYGDKEDLTPCGLPLTDGQVCGDVFGDPQKHGGEATPLKNHPANSGDRCPYNHNDLKVDFSACELTTYAKKHNRAMATGGAGNLAHDPDENGLCIDCHPHHLEE